MACFVERLGLDFFLSFRKIVKLSIDFFSISISSMVSLFTSTAPLNSLLWISEFLHACDSSLYVSFGCFPTFYSFLGVSGCVWIILKPTFWTKFALNYRFWWSFVLKTLLDYKFLILLLLDCEILCAKLSCVHLLVFWSVSEKNLVQIFSLLNNLPMWAGYLSEVFLSKVCIK